MVAICLISALVLWGARALATYLQSHARFSAIGSTNRLHHFSLGWMWNSGDDIPKAFAVSQFSSIIRPSETGFQTCQTSSSECLTQQRHLILSDAWPLLSFNEMYWKFWEITDGCIPATFVPIALLFMTWPWPSAFGYFSIFGACPVLTPCHPSAHFWRWDCLPKDMVCFIITVVSIWTQTSLFSKTWVL